VIHNDYASLSNRKGYPEGHAEVIRELVVPTIREGRVVAVLGVGNKPSDYTEQDVNLVSYIADLVWSIVEQKRASEEIYQLNTQLEHLAMTDDLTGLMNRRSFFIRGARELEDIRCEEMPCGLLMLDVDRFKNINDRYGHEAGDQVLQNVAQILAENVREVDLVARLGGEEFGVLLPNLGKEDSIRLAERLRQAVENAGITIQGIKMSVTISVGVALYDQSCLDFDTILRHADSAMYQAKNLGRNRVVVLE
jgi:diguanylate cyclase (GGDEF)-like protein